MKQKIYLMIALLCLLGLGACTDKTDNSTFPGQQEMEKSLVGPTNTNLNGEDAIDINDTPQGTWGR